MWTWHKLELDKEHCSWKKVDEAHHLVDEFVCAIIGEVNVFTRGGSLSLVTEWDETGLLRPSCLSFALLSGKKRAAWDTQS